MSLDDQNPPNLRSRPSPNTRLLVGVAAGLFLIVVGLVVVWPRVRERSAVKAIEALGGHAEYAFERRSPLIVAPPPGPAFVWRFLDHRLIFRAEAIRFYGVGGRHSRVTDDSFMPLLSSFSNLRHLSLGSIDMTNRGLKWLSSHPNLETLYLAETKLRDEPLTGLESLNLRWLSLRRTQVGDVAVASLATLTNLEHLDLERTRVSDVGLKSLERLHHLKRLRIGRTKTTEAGIEELRKKLPACVIDWEPLVPATTRTR